MSVRQSAKRDLHWEYFFVIEEDLFRTSRYIDFCKAHLSVYSIEFAHILLAAASEVDTVLKLVCKGLDSSTKVVDINQYRGVMRAHSKEFPKRKVAAPAYGLEFCPWENWGDGKARNPDWWWGYNKVKHERNAHFDKATLQNALNAVGGLYCCLEQYYVVVQKGNLFYESPKGKFLKLLP